MEKSCRNTVPEVLAPGTQQQKQTLLGAVVSPGCIFLRLSLCCSYYAHTTCPYFSALVDRTFTSEIENLDLVHSLHLRELMQDVDFFFFFLTWIPLTAWPQVEVGISVSPMKLKFCNQLGLCNR